jgi:diaminopimelate epimerase
MAIRIKFTKMHSLGNDFVALDLVSQNIKLNEKLISRLANRQFGIGCDQVLTLEPPKNPKADFLYRVYNATGQEVGQCGNGARCIARLAKDNHLLFREDCLLETQQNLMRVAFLDAHRLQVDLPTPCFSAEEIPTTLRPSAARDYLLPFEKETRRAFLISMGNPHCIFFVPALHQSNFAQIAERLQTDLALFPQGVNVSFVKVNAKNNISMQTYERGVGLTLACGSAACAAVVAGISNKELGNTVRVDFSHGSLTVHWQGNGQPVQLIGTATSTFRGYFVLNAAEPAY